jgi:hypothetical protein
MEHLINPSEVDRMQPSIPHSPWLEFDHDTTQQFPLASFEEYPVQRGWNTARLQALRQGGFSEDTSFTSTLAMLQSWLFFGLLESAFQQHFPTTLFLTSSEGTQINGKSYSRVLNTNYLRTFYQQWHLDFLDLPDDKKDCLAASFARSLHGPRDWALYLEVKLRHRIADYNTPPLSSVLNETIRNVMLLMELLGKAVPQAFPQSGFVHQQMDLDPGGEISYRLQQRGWCPSSSRMLMNKYGPSVAMYATLLHPMEQPDVRHDHCNRAQCVAYNVDVSTYSPKHVHQPCSCERVIPPPKDVYDILHSGSFPILDGESIIADAQQGELIVRRHNQDMEYLAFSHVWSDGLGSVTEKGLPRCQVVYLTHLCKAITGSNLFWIDGLCVPSDAKTRTAAIHLMAATYAKASTTLVLDYSLRQCSSSATIEEIALRILSSVWLRRLWTLQEGALASNLVFLLRDAFLPLPHLLSQIFVSGFSGPISAALLSELSGFNRKLYATKAAHINHVQRLMGYRTSSRVDDETLAIAPLFHIDVKSLTPHNGEARKMVFWKALKAAPTDVIFSDAPRLTTPGFRWAPRTLMRGDANIFGPGVGQITERGLLGEFAVLDLEERSTVEKNKSRRLLDVARRGAFRVFDCVETESSEDCGGLSRDTVSCDAIAVREQPTGELIPGVAIVLRKTGTLDKTEDEGGEVSVFRFAARAIIVVDEFADLVQWGSTLPSDAIIARRAAKTLCIS